MDIGTQELEMMLKMLECKREEQKMLQIQIEEISANETMIEELQREHA